MRLGELAVEADVDIATEKRDAADGEPAGVRVKSAEGDAAGLMEAGASANGEANSENEAGGVLLPCIAYGRWPCRIGEHDRGGGDGISPCNGVATAQGGRGSFPSFGEALRPALPPTATGAAGT